MILLSPIKESIKSANPLLTNAIFGLTRTLFICLGISFSTCDSSETFHPEHSTNYMFISNFVDDGYLKELEIVDDDAYDDTVRVFERGQETLITFEAYSDVETSAKNPRDFLLFYFRNEEDSGYQFHSSLSNLYTMRHTQQFLERMIPGRGVSINLLKKWRLAGVKKTGDHSLQAFYIPPGANEEKSVKNAYVEFVYDTVYITINTSRLNQRKVSISPHLDSVFHGQTSEILIHGPAFYSKHLGRNMSNGVTHRFSIQKMDYSAAFTDSLFEACKRKISGR